MRSPSLATALALALAAPVAFEGGAAWAQPNAISPGYWETDNQVVSPVRSSKVERRCIRPQDVAKFMNGPSNHIYHCTYPTRVIGPGTIRLKGTCAAKDGRPIPIWGDGTFTEDSFHMDAHVTVPFGPLNVPGHAVTDAHRLAAECPAATDTAATAPSPAPQTSDPPSPQ